MSLIVSPEKFYGAPSAKELRISALIKDKKRKRTLKRELPNYLNTLLGPSRTWKIFKKQCDALEFVENKGNQLMCFAFEHGAASRAFLVCHPIILWFVNENRTIDQRCNYEIIREHTLCKLYLDIEYECEYNADKNGLRMLNTLKRIVFYYLQKWLNISCSNSEVLDLDSSTSHKFSRHLIFQIQGSAFKNNYSVGNFIKAIKDKITEATASPEVMDKCSQKFDLSKDEIGELMITDRKGYRKPFIDVGVYTKNRHFRLYGNTKLHKRTPLRLSENNSFVPKGKEEYALFLSSLITYFPDEVKTLHEFGEDRKPTIVTKLPVKITPDLQVKKASLEDFISQCVAPNGRIRRSSTNGYKIIYDIVNNRFCQNIQREHRSNNIRLVVDLQRMVFYQTCYDPECKDFASIPIPLPASLTFTPEEDQFLLDASEVILTDDDLLDFLNGGDFMYGDWDTSNNLVFTDNDDDVLMNVDESVINNATGHSNLCDSGFISDETITDSVLIEIADCVEMFDSFEGSVT